jgi:hypothetical protein
MTARPGARLPSPHWVRVPAPLAWADTAPAALADEPVLTLGLAVRARPFAGTTPPAGAAAARAGARHAAAATPAPRDYTRTAEFGTGAGHERSTSVTSRRSFVALKLAYLEAAAMLHGADSQWLREQVRTAEEPIDLWLLRAPLFAGLAGTCPERRRLRHRLRSALTATFGEPQPNTVFAPLR